MNVPFGNTTLGKFLQDHKVGKEDKKYTHTHIYGICGGKFNITGDEIDKFYDIYYDYIFQQGGQTSLTETNSLMTCIKIDLDFKFNSDKIQRKYTQKHLEDIVKLYITSIDQWVVTSEDYQRHCFIMEKTNAKLDKHLDDGVMAIKDGIHIMFPHIVVPTYVQLKIREDVYKKAIGIFKDMGCKNEARDIVDMSVIKTNGWMVYGSSKKDSEAYVLTQIMNFKEKEDGQEDYEMEYVSTEQYSNKELCRLLSIKNGMDESIIKLEKQNEVAEGMKEYEEGGGNMKTLKTGKKGKKNKITDTYFDTIKNIVSLLGDGRADNFKQWLDIGWTLHNIENSDRMLDLWIEFSRRAPDYANECEDSCSKEWLKMKDEGYGEGSLRFWAKEDNPEKYREFISRDIRELIGKQVKSGGKQKNATNWDVAQIVHKMFKDEFVCVSGKHSTWFQYKNHRWQKLDDDTILRSKLSTEVYREYNSYLVSCQQQSFSADDDFQNVRDRICTIMRDLKQTGFKNNVMKEAVEFFYDDGQKFNDKLDNTEHNKHLLCFENGIYDLIKDEFRDGRPDDYISLCTNIEYMPYDEEDEHTMQIYDFINKVLTNADVRLYVLKYLASCLSGSTKNEEFHIWSGSGGNGKSKIIELFEAAFGDYACKLPIEVLTKGRNKAGQASPEKAVLKGRRLAVLQEPDEGAKLDVGLMKELTGGDKIQARPLYGMPIEFKPQAKFVLTCNDKPQLPYHDEGTWRRVRLVEFLSRFVDNPDPSEPHEFKKDRSIADNFHYWKEAFMSILIHYHGIYKKEGIKEPNEVKFYTEQFRKSNDIFGEFIRDCIVEVPGAYFDTTELKTFFKGWITQTVGGNIAKQMKDVVIYFKKHFASKYVEQTHKKSGWRDITHKDLLKKDDDDIMMDELDN